MVTVTAYTDALARGKKTGVSRAPAAEAIAMFCNANLHLLVGAVSAELVWTGAMARRMSFLEFGRMCGRNPMEVEALQWIDTVIVTHDSGRYRLDFNYAKHGILYDSYDARHAVYELALTTSLDESDAQKLVAEALEFGVSGRELKR